MRFYFFARLREYNNLAMRKKLLSVALLSLGFLSLLSCSAKAVYRPYSYGELAQPITKKEIKENYERMGTYSSLKSSDYEEITPSLPSLYRYGSVRKVLPSVGEQRLTVIPVDFDDYPFVEDYHQRIEAAFFDDSASNQYVSLAEYYDKASYHRLHVVGEVVEGAFRCKETYATLKTKNNAAQTKSALTKIHADALAWYNQNHDVALTNDDAVFFVYSAPYSGMQDGSSSRSSMMWAFAVNDPAPIGWASYYMMHPSDTGFVDAHTYIHEFGHLLGLKDYYDVNSYSELSPCSPLGRMDMMDCSLGEHNAFSKMMLDWAHPYVPLDKCTITLRPSSGNEDCLLLPLQGFNGTPYDEYLLLEFYTPTYLNYADATMRAEVEMSLFKKPGIKAYHVDGRLGLYEARGKNPVAPLSENVALGGQSLDLYCENSGTVSGGYASSNRGFLVQLLDASSYNGKLVENYIASDHIEDRPIGGKTAHLRDSLFQVGQGIGVSYPGLSLHTGRYLGFGFIVEKITATYATLSVFPLK